MFVHQTAGLPTSGQVKDMLYCTGGQTFDNHGRQFVQNLVEDLISNSFEILVLIQWLLILLYVINLIYVSVGQMFY